MRFLITGATSFIGSYLLERLLSEGHFVLALTSSPTKLNLTSDLLSVHQTYRDDPLLYPSLLYSVDHIIHLSSPPSSSLPSTTAPSFYDAISYTNKLITACLDHPIKSFIYPSSVNIYSNVPCGTYTTDSPLLASSPYSSLKTTLESRIALSPLPSTILRLSNIFGLSTLESLQASPLFITDIVRQAISKRSIELYSNALQKRDFLPISRLYKIITILTSSQTPPSSPTSTVYNVTSSKSYTLLKVAEIVSQLYYEFSGYQCPIYHRTPLEPTPSFSYSSSFPAYLSCSADELHSLLHSLVSLFYQNCP